MVTHHITDHPIVAKILSFNSRLFLVVVISIFVSFTTEGVAQNSPSIPAKGKFIRNITIKVRDIFDSNDTLLYSVANAAKVNTQESIVRRELLFKEGDPYNPFAIEETARNLRLLKYLREIRVHPHFDGDAVDVEVEAQDVWTFIPAITYSSGAGQKRQGVALSDSNFMGLASRIEGRYDQEENRSSTGIVYSDPQFLGTRKNFGVAAVNRSDGSITSAYYRNPFRSLRQQESWNFEASRGDTVGRLFSGGTETYIFRQNIDRYEMSYTFAGPSTSAKKTSPATAEFPGIYAGQRILSNRYSVGFAYSNDIFTQASRSDYQNLDLDPAVVGSDPRDLPKNRRLNGPLVRYQNIEPFFLPMNYIDRFDRVEDYNLGDESLVSLQLAARQFGSLDNALVITGNRSRGWKFSDTSFLRGEIGGTTRLYTSSVENTLLRTEAKYYNVMGDLFVGDMFLGRHTFATNFFVDFGENLDRDRQFLLGADNSLRGYEINTFEGDKRMVLNLEERAHVIDEIFQLVSVGTAAFVDIGGATRGTLGTIVTDDLYSDVGVGLRLGFPRASGGGVLRLDIAVPLRDGPDGSKQGEPRIVVSAGQLFGARLRSEQVGAENATVGVGFDR